MRRASWTWSAFSHADARSAYLNGRTEKAASLERLGGLFRLVIDAKAGFEMKHDPTIRTPTKSTASCRSISSPQRTDGVLLKPSYFAVIGHCLQEAVFDDGRRRYVDYARDLGRRFCAIPWRIEHPGKPCACPKIVRPQMQALDIDPDALKTGYDLALRAVHGLR